MRRNPAPVDLALIEAFCNTAIHLHSQDDLALPATAAEWLSARGFPALRGEREIKALIDARETLRAFIADRTDPEAIRSLNDLIASVSGPPAVGADGTLALRAATDAPVTGVICTVLEALLQHGLTGHGTRLKACAAPECRWVFYDRAPSANGLWCDMNICGSRHKMRAYRARTNSAESPSPPARA